MLPHRFDGQAQDPGGHTAGRTVEIDDAYLGGERSAGKAGRGSENKVPFVASVQTTEDGLPHLACLSPRPFTNKAIKEFLARQTALPPTLVSDGLNCF